MKKLSLMIVFLMLLVAVLAFSTSAAAFTRGPENDRITPEDVESIELIEGETGYDATGNGYYKGEEHNSFPELVLDGDYTTAWGGKSNAKLKITLKNEWEITEAKLALFANWAWANVYFYDADGKQLGMKGNTITNADGIYYKWGYDATNSEKIDFTAGVSNIPYGDNDKAVKSIVYTTQGKWDYLPIVFEFILTGRERQPSVGCEKHQFELTYPIAPTCTEDGVAVNKCKLCGAEESPVVAPALGHAWDTYTVLPAENCFSTPKIEFECTRCEETVIRDNHIKDVTDYADILNGVTIAGSGSYTNGTMFDNDMEKFQQASSNWFVSAEVELDRVYYLSSVTIWTGYTTHHSGNNSADWVMTFYYMAPDGSEWIEAGTKQVPPTDYSITWAPAGVHTLELESTICAKAVKIRVDGITHASGIVFEAEIAGSILPDTPVTGHTWVADDTVAPTCIHRGYTNYTCSVCEATKQDTFERFTGVHTFAPVLEEKDEEGNVIWTPTEATCTAAGNKKDKCEVCGHVEEKNIDPLGHSMQAATCTAPATCTRENCGYTEGEALGHNYVAGEQAEDGSVTYTCSNCNDAYVINNSLVNGEYYLGTDLVVFNNGALSAMGGEYTYTYNVTTGMIDTDAGVFFQVIEGKIYLRGAELLHQHTGEGYIAEKQEDGSINYICQFCGQVMYVINNALVNGEYYLGTDLVVFNNGALSAMGGEFTYTYNVTTGMIDTDAGIFFQVIDGVIYFKGATALHQHNGEGYVADAQEDGSVNYVCNACGTVMYVVNNALVNGEYYLGTDLVVFNNGVLSAMGGEFTYTYNVTTGMIDTDAGIFFQVIDGVIYFKGATALHQHNENTLSTNTTDASCTTDGAIVTICQFCGPIAEETIEATGHVNSYDDDAYVYEGANCTTEGYEKDICANCGEEFTVVLPIEPDNHMADWDSAEYKDATCQDDGYEKYTCLFCEQTITIVYESNEYAHVWDEKLGVFVPATCKDAGYEYKKCSLCGFESNEEFGPYESAHKYDDGVKGDGVIVYTCTLCDYSYEEEIIVYPELPLGDTAIEIVAGEWGWTNSVYYSVSVPGNYVLTFDVNDNINLILGEYSNVMLETSPYEFTVNEGDVVTFTFMTFDFEAGTVNVNLAAKVSHVHVEEVIPAVRPTPSKAGTTAGVKCSDCGETLVAPVAVTVSDMADTRDPSFRIAAATLTLMDSIIVNYQSVVTAGYNNPYMVFVFMGEEYVIESSGVDATTGRLIFDFDKVEAHWMNENIEAYIYAETAEGEYSRNMILQYSVKNYAVNQLKKNDAALSTVISDLLVMGAKTQLYTGYKTNELVTDAVVAAGYTLTPSTFNGVDASYNVAKPVTGDRTTGTDWKSATVYLGSRTVLQFEFVTDDVESLVAKMTVAGKTVEYTAEDFDYNASNGRYVVSVDFFSALQYGENIVGTFERNGETVGSTITYSVNAYAYRNVGAASGKTLDLIKALYVYGQSVESYFGK